MLKKSLLAATLLVVIAGPALAQTATQQSQMPPQQQGQRERPFERLDRNNDGVITGEEVTIARTATFTALDINRDAFLTGEEMRLSGWRVRPGGQSARAVYTGPRYDGGGINLIAADVNRDGTITRAEFDAAHQNSPEHSAAFSDQLRNDLFRHLDTNRDGTITNSDMIASKRPPLITRSEPFLADGPPSPMEMGGPPNIRRHNPDTNNDQKVSLAEWLARPNPLFDRGDTNNDGRVTREEAAAFTRQAREQRPPAKRPW
jgi:Ca2+-binding EF-hand superfamily protein